MQYPARPYAAGALPDGSQQHPQHQRIGDSGRSAVLHRKQRRLHAHCRPGSQRLQQPLHHAELLAIDAACKALGGWRLWECELFVTLEPCPMCAGAIVNSRIRRVVYGAADAKAGCCGSVTDLFALPFNHHPVVEQGLRAEEAGALLQAFFKELRVRLAARPRWKRPADPAENMKKP